MKNYASKRAKKGKLAYRTPDRFIYNALSAIYRAKTRYRKFLKTAKEKCREKKNIKDS